MKKLIRGTLALLLCAALLGNYAMAAETLHEDYTRLAGETALASGVYLVDGVRQAEHWLEYTPNKTVKPVVVYGSKVCNYGSFSSMAALLQKRGMNVIGGINGDYYVVATNQPLGMVVSEGLLKSSDAGLLSVGFRSDGTAFIGKPALNMSVELGTETYGLAAVNKVRSGVGYHLFTEDFSYTTKNSKPGWDVILSAEPDAKLTVNCRLALKVEEIRESEVDIPLPAGKYILSLPKDTDDWRKGGIQAIKPGDTVYVNISTDPVWDEAEYAVGSLMKLVTGGIVEPGLDDREIAPRSAVGIRADGTMLLFTVDGRQSGYSKGYTIASLAARLAELGCVEACIMDGGGSTGLSAMYIGDGAAALVNRPSAGERSVSTYIMLAAQDAGSGNAAYLGVKPSATVALSGTRVPLTLGAADETGRPVTAPAASYSLVSGDGRLEGNTLVCGGGGTVTVKASFGALSGAASVSVIDTPESITVTGDGETVSSLKLPQGYKLDLNAEASWNGFKLYAQDTSFLWAVTGGIGKIDENGVFTASDTAAQGEITVSSGSLTRIIPVTVGTINVLLEDFESSTGALAGADHNRETLYVAVGKGSAKLSYTPDGSGSRTWKASYKPVKYTSYVNLQVLGDGSGNTLFAMDANGNKVDLCTLDFVGWRRCTVTSQGLSGIGISGNTTSEIYIDRLVASSSPTTDEAAPDITGASVESTAFNALVLDETDGILAKNAIQLLWDGKALDFQYNEGTVSAQLPGKPGLHKLTLRATDVSGNISEFSVLTGDSTGDSFTDIGGHWSRNYVNYMAATGIMLPATANGTLFKPDELMTRELFARSICLWMGVDVTKYSEYPLEFMDIDKISAEGLPYVRAACALGILKGADVGGKLYFLPGDGLTRAQAMTVVGRIQGMGFDEGKLDFTDSDNIQAWSLPYIRQLVARGVINGYDDGRIDPAGPLTRAQVAKILTLVI